MSGTCVPDFQAILVEDLFLTSKQGRLRFGDKIYFRKNLKQRMPNMGVDYEMLDFYPSNHSELLKPIRAEYFD